jgi:hypothetical protein
MPTKLVGDSFAPGSITANQLVVGALNPVLTSVAVANSSYSIIGGNMSVSGGYIVVTGNGFNPTSIVLIDNTNATSTTYVSPTTLRAQIPARSAGSYTVYVNDTSTGATVIKVNGLTFA